MNLSAPRTSSPSSALSNPHLIISHPSLFLSPDPSHLPSSAPLIPPLKTFTSDQPKTPPLDHPRPQIFQKPHKNRHHPFTRDAGGGWCRFEIGVLPWISGGGGGQLTIQGKIHPKIHLRAQRLAVLGVAAEGLKVLISLWIFRCFSSLSFAKISSVSVVRLRRERTSLAPLAQAVPSPFPSSSPAQPPKGSRL